MIFWLPPTYIVDQHHSNASNNAFRIVIRRGIPCFGAVLCQERAEWAWKWKRLQLPRFISSLRREMELFGHAVEVEVAVRHYAMDRDAYEHSEARALTSYRQFRGIPLADILAGLVRNRIKAALWVDRHSNYVRMALEAAQ